jgi:molybdate transport system substrate-binding protein
MANHRRRFMREILLAVLALGTVLSACDHSESRSAAKPGVAQRPAAAASPAPLPAQEEQVVIFAASSLRDGFGEVAKLFKHTHPNVKVTFNFAGSQELRTQVEQGAQADVFASADHKHMDELVHANLATVPITFARNEPVIVVAKESAAQIHTMADLPKAERIVLGAKEVPIGRYTEQILELASARFGNDFRQRVEAKVVSRELNVKQVLAKVSLGEAQAGVVYRTDVRGAKDITTVDIPSNLNVVAEYPMAVLAKAPHPALAQAWLELVSSAEGQNTLHKAGFLPPSASAKGP